jgi:hypothetical protein
VGEDASKELLFKCRSKHPVKLTPVIKYWKRIFFPIFHSPYTPYMQIQIHTHREIPFLQKKEVAWSLKKAFLGALEQARSPMVGGNCVSVFSFMI